MSDTNLNHVETEPDIKGSFNKILSRIQEEYAICHCQ